MGELITLPRTCAFGAALDAASSVVAGEDAPLQALYAEWRAAEDAWDLAIERSPTGTQLEESELAYAAEYRLLSAPARTAEGMLLKLGFWLRLRQYFIHELPVDKRPLKDVPWEHQAVVAVIHDLRRIAGSAAS